MSEGEGLLFAVDAAYVSELKVIVMLNLPRELRTARLLLRRWRSDDRAAYARINADPRVVEFLPGPMSREESDAAMDRIEAHFQRHGFGAWAVEIPGITPFVDSSGFPSRGSRRPSRPASRSAGVWTPTTGPRLRDEGAPGRRWSCGFGPLGLAEIVSFTVPDNLRSRRVMEKIGMTHSPDENFDHPLLPAGHPLRRHVLYRITR